MTHGGMIAAGRTYPGLELALMAFHATALNPGLPPMQQELLDRHYLRKHGKNACYGQS